MKRSRQLDIYIDESGNFAPYTKQNPIYSVSFVFVERTDEISERSLFFSKSLSRLPGGETFVHVGNLVRGKDPYEGMLREDRQKLFYCLFMYAKRLDMSFYSFHVRKDESGGNVFGLSAKIHAAISEMLTNYHGYFESFDRVVVHYDNGQTELRLVLQSAFLGGVLCEVRFVETRQQEEPIMQVADMNAIWRPYISRSRTDIRRVRIFPSLAKQRATSIGNT